MQVKSIAISNLSSFVDFSNDSEFEKHNLFFGTNGSGKSTLVRLLQHLEAYASGAESDEDLKGFFRSHISKEAGNGAIEIQIRFQSATRHIRYETEGNHLDVRGDGWFPIKVFNDDYTNRNISQTVDINLPESGLVIGQSNMEMETLRQERETLEQNIANRKQDAISVIAEATANFKEETGSQSNLDDVISVENLWSEKCDFAEDKDSLERRKLLGFGKPERRISRLDEDMFKHSLNTVELEKRCAERVLPPKVADTLALVLKEHTAFFRSGVRLYELEAEHTCPFCRRQWEDAEARINEYRSFLDSEYTSKRSQIETAKAEIEKYRSKILDHKSRMDVAKSTASEEGKKYLVDTTGWQELSYRQDLHDELVAILNDKYTDMEKTCTIKAKLDALQESHVAIVKNNNLIIREIENSIASIMAKRRQANVEVSHHYMYSKWTSYANERRQYTSLQKRLVEIDQRIQELEEDESSQDTVQAVFNGLLQYIGLTEYFMDTEKRLNIRLGRQYDISKEGNRISTAQRKILSLCYFFADIVSKVKRIGDLSNYILVFDDPVDSADYVYFHSIASVLEESEKILGHILRKQGVRFGQFFVLTHNSLLYDRLTCSQSYQHHHKHLLKVENRTLLANADRKINNYAIYLSEISKYYNNPRQDKRRMTYIGNLIRRVLEILYSFDSLGSNDFKDALDGMGKTKLALIANHLSHESFTKVLNPLPDSNELREACRELFEVIKERHPYQYDTIQEKYDVVI
jgi:energy-coupling factor transporter ATP-binding protein EcfA2